jgi:GNAT superfamily N-acetyltransferase
MVNGTAVLRDHGPYVRIASEPDEAALLEILKQDYKENGVGPLSIPTVERVIQQGTRRNGGIIGIVDGQDEIAGTIGIAFDRWWYSEPDDPGGALLREMWVYVRPNYRHDGQIVEALIDFAKDYADVLSRELGHSLPLVLAVLGNERIEAKVRLFRRKFPLAGAAFLHRPKV